MHVDDTPLNVDTIACAWIDGLNLKRTQLLERGGRQERNEVYEQCRS